jgi:hypothetical protein
MDYKSFFWKCKLTCIILQQACGKDCDQTNSSNRLSSHSHLGYFSQEICVYHYYCSSCNSNVLLGKILHCASYLCIHMVTGLSEFLPKKHGDSSHHVFTHHHAFTHIQSYLIHQKKGLIIHCYQGC